MTDVALLEVRDCDCSILRFSAVHHTEHQLAYLVAVDVGWARVSAQLSTYLYGPPVKFFQDLARSWRGWDGVKTWEDLEHRLDLSATCDKIGHITLKVMMRDAADAGRVELPLCFEAGEPERLANDVCVFFEAVQSNASI